MIEAGSAATAASSLKAERGLLALHLIGKLDAVTREEMEGLVREDPRRALVGLVEEAAQEYRGEGDQRYPVRR